MMGSVHFPSPSFKRVGLQVDYIVTEDERNERLYNYT